MTQPHATQPIIAVEGLVKHFGVVQALRGVTLSFEPGQVHGLIGENGAGKSTLMNVLAGIHQPTAGRLLLRGQPVIFPTPAAALDAGIAMIHQELNLIDELSVADNIFLGREPVRAGLVQHRKMQDQAREILHGFECDIDPRQRVGRLPIAHKQMVEIAKAVSCRAKVLIMDEPTAVLTRREVTMLFGLIRRLRSQGVAIIYISHILPEVLDVCDVITVLRDGEHVRTLARAEAGAGHAAESKLAGLMVGRAMSEHFPPRLSHGQKLALRAQAVSCHPHQQPVSFELRAGEIVGFAGLIGAGRTELAESIAGLRPMLGGHVEVDGQAATLRTPLDAVKHGICYLSEDRKAAGLTLGMSITHNTTLVSLRRYCHPLIRGHEEAAAAQRHVTALRTRIGRLRDPVSTLSGGNQQKVALAKWLEMNPRVLILDEPTRGVDIGAKEEIYRLIQQLAQQGMACMFISSELNEVLGMSHRIVVMRAGRIMGILDGPTATEQQVMHLAAGVGSTRETVPA